jgi:hypothetical protein
MVNHTIRQTYASRDEIFVLGQHQFEAQAVSASGRWSGKKWYGPPRWHLEHRFQVWADNLFLGAGSNDTSITRKARVQVKVQSDGGYQNAFSSFLATDPATNR